MKWTALAAFILALTGCGLQIQSADLFLLTRTGQGHKLTLLVNDDGTVTCNRNSNRMLPGPLLLQARDLANSLNSDAQAKLNIPSQPDSVFRYSIRVQDGTISFPDTAGALHPTLAQTELFALRTAQQACGLKG